MTMNIIKKLVYKLTIIYLSMLLSWLIIVIYQQFPYYWGLYMQAFERIIIQINFIYIYIYV